MLARRIRRRASLVVAVSPSAFAPHMVGDRYPVRRGTVTESLSEPEIARLYARRHAMLDVSRPGSREVMDAAFAPPRRSDDGMPDRAGALADDVGRLRTVFLPVGPVAHPGAPWLRDALQQAHVRAVHKVLPLVRGSGPAVLTRLASWEPYYGEGWTAGRSASFAPATSHLSSHAAVFAYTGCISCQATRNLRVAPGASHGAGVETYRCSFEDELAIAAIAFAAIAGQILADMETIGIVRAVVEFDGFSEAVSFGETDGTGVWGAPEYSRMRQAPAVYRGDALSDLLELRDDPLAAARRLVDPWLAAFCDDDSVWSRITTLTPAS